MKGLICIAIAGAALLASCSDGKGRIAENAPLVPQVSDVRKVGKLELAEMTVTKMGTIDDLRLEDAKGFGQKTRALLNALKIGGRKGAYSYDTYVRAYIDLNELTDSDLTVDTVAHTYRLTLPDIRTEIVGCEPTLREEHYRVTGLRSNISAQERASLKEEMNTMLRKEISSNGEFRRVLTEKAREKGRAWFEALFAASGYTGEVVFK